MVNLDLRTHIYRPLRQVFRFVATPENDFQWQYGTLASDQLSNGEMGMGSLFRAVGHFMGQRMESIFEVTEFEPNRRYGFKSLSGPLVSQTLYTFEMQEGKSELHVTVQLNPENHLKPATILVEKRLKKQYRENLALLKSVLEASQVDRSPQLSSL